MQDLVTSLLKQQLGDAFQKKAAESFGLKSEQASSLTQNALPAILNGLAKNSESSSGATSLFKALSKPKHDGNILNQVEGLLKAPEKGEGNGILKHILGSTKEQVTEAIAGETKTSSDQSQKMMMVLAPIVMGALGKAVRSEKLNAEQLGTLLQVVRKDKSFAGKANALATQFLDKDKDGDYKDDVFNMIKNWIGKKISKK